MAADASPRPPTGVAFTTEQLLLTATKLAQLQAALGDEDALSICISEAEAEVARYLTGYVVDQAAQDGWIRALALSKAYGLIGPAPDDVQKLYDAAIAELQAIAAGKRPNLPRTETDSVSPSEGRWGSADKFI